MKVTKHEIEYQSAPYPDKHIIPKGTPVRPALNLFTEDGQKYWAEPWEGISDLSWSWYSTYGFLLSADEVEEAP